MKLKKAMPFLVIGGVAFLIYKMCNMPQVKNAQPFYKPVTSPPVYDHLYQDARMTEIVGK